MGAGSQSIPGVFLSWLVADKVREITRRLKGIDGLHAADLPIANIRRRFNHANLSLYHPDTITAHPRTIQYINIHFRGFHTWTDIKR